jgi:hypothetical protein
VRRPMPTLRGLQTQKPPVRGGFIGRSFYLPSPQNLHPGPAEDTQGLRVLGTSLPGSAIDVLGQGMPLASRVGEGDRASQSLITSSSKDGISVRMLGQGEADPLGQLGDLIDRCHQGAEHSEHDRGSGSKLGFTGRAGQWSALSLCLTGFLVKASLRSALAYRTIKNDGEDYQ